MLRATALAAMLLAAGLQTTAAGADPEPPEPTARQGLSNSVLRDALDAGAPDDPSQSERSSHAIRVEAHSALPTDQLRQLVEAYGGTYEGAVPGHLVQALVPADRLEALEADPGVEYLTPAVRVDEPQDSPSSTGMPQFGPRFAQNIIKTNADDWHLAGFSGTGVKVGIIDRFNAGKWQAAKAAGEVRDPAGTVCRSNGQVCNVYGSEPGGGTHGVAVAESVLDMAPNATIYLGAAYTTSDLVAVVDYMYAQGVKVLSRSLAAPLDGPGDGTGTMGAIVDYAVSKGMLWVNSAGNTANGGYWRGTWRDDDNDGWLNFTANDETLAFDCAYIMGFRWSDWMTPASLRTDYNVYVREVQTGAAVGNSTGFQQQGAPPIEYAEGVCNTSNKVELLVYRAAAGSGTTGDVLEFMTNGIGVEHASSAYSAGQPASDSKSTGMLSVGSIDPALGTTASASSGRGPTNDGRTKPDVMGASCYLSLSYSPCFHGTSAATPTVSGAAALVLSAFPSYTPAQVKSYLMYFAQDRGPSGPDYTYGNGEVILPLSQGMAKCPPDDAFEPNDHPAGARTWAPGQQLSGVVCPLNDDYFAFDAPMGAGVTITVTYQPAAGDLDLQLIDPAGNVVGASDATTGTEQIGVTTATSGVHRVRIYGYNGTYSPYQATLAVNSPLPGGPGPSPGLPQPQPGDPSAGFTTAYTAVGPVRLADTRGGSGFTRVDDCTIRVRVAGRSGVPVGAAAAAITLTVPQATADGWAAMWPSGTEWNGVSNINIRSGETRANSAIVQLGSTGAVDIYTSACGTGTIVDVSGVFLPATTAAAGRLVPVAPVRVLDASAAPIAVTLTPAQLGVPADATAVAVNLTVDGSNRGGYLTAWGAGTTQPDASVLNTDAGGQTRAAATLVPLTPQGMSLWQNIGGRLIVDVTGYFTGSSAGVSSSGLFTPYLPTRIFDNRPQRTAVNSWSAIPMTLSGVSAVAANVTVTNVEGGGYLTVAAEPGPVTTSTVNASARGDSVANLAVVPTAGTLQVFSGDTAASTIVDLAGTFS